MARIELLFELGFFVAKIRAKEFPLEQTYLNSYFCTLSLSGALSLSLSLLRSFRVKTLSLSFSFALQRFRLLLELLQSDDASIERLPAAISDNQSTATPATNKRIEQANWVKNREEKQTTRQQQHDMYYNNNNGQQQWRQNEKITAINVIKKAPLNERTSRRNRHKLRPNQLDTH